MHLCDTVAIAQTHNLFVACTDPDASNLTTASHGPDLDLGFKNKISHLSPHLPVVGLSRLFYKQPVLIVSACLLPCQSHCGYAVGGPFRLDKYKYLAVGQPTITSW